FLVGQFAAHERVTELARLDLQRLRVAGDLFPTGVLERRLERALAAVVGRTTYEDDEMRRDRDRHRLGRGQRELDPRKVDPSRPALEELANVDVLDEQRSDDLHAPRTLPTPGCLRDLSPLRRRIAQTLASG